MMKSWVDLYAVVAVLMCVCTLVGSNDVVNPVTQVGHTGVHSGGAHVAVRGAPGNNADKIPCTIPLADQRATRVTLKRHTHKTNINDT